MKKTVTVEKNLCDACEKNEGNACNPCLKCGRVYCYECSQTNVVDYSHGVNAGGSGDGRYCIPCDVELRKGHDPLHRAYLAIRALRNESRGWYEAFKDRQKIAEEALERLREGRPRGLTK